MPASDPNLNLEQILDVSLHCDFPGTIDLLVEKSAAAAAALRYAVSSFYTKSDVSVYWNPAREKAGMYFRPEFNEEEFEQGKVLLADKVGADHVHPEPLTGYDLQDWWVKVAYSPTLRRFGELLQFFPSKDIPGFGGRPIASTIASGLLGTGLGYGTGYIAEKFLPSWAQKPGTLRKRLALLGGLAGGTLGAVPGLINWSQNRDFNDPTLMSGFPEDGWEKDLKGSRYKEAVDQFLIRRTFDNYPPPYVWSLQQDAAQNTPIIRTDALGSMMQNYGADPQLTAMTMGSVYGANQMPDPGSNPGTVTPHQTGLFGMMMGAAGGGIKGYLTGRAVGMGLGLLTGMPVGTQETLGRTGAALGVVNALVPRLFN
jgi:hypothetical protein